MFYALLLSGIVIAGAVLALQRRGLYSTLACLSFEGTERERIVKLGTRTATSGIEVFTKVMHEVRIFNDLNIIMPCKRGVAVLYIEELGKLYSNPKYITASADGFVRLMYLYACLNMHARTSDEFIKKQLVKNCIYIFGERDTIKKCISKKLRHSSLFLFTEHQPRYKFLQGSSFSKFAGTPNFEIRMQGEPVPLKPVHARSSVSYVGGGVKVKNFVDKELPVECFELNAGSAQFVWNAGADKMRYNLSHTADSFFYCRDGHAVGILVLGKKSFGSSICEKGDDLRIYINTEGAAKIFIAHARTKSEAVAALNKVKQRGGALAYLRTAEEARVIEEAEMIFEQSCKSRFVSGEKLKDKHALALKYVPTLHLHTLVYQLETADDFFAVTDKFALFKLAASASVNLNVVCLYSALNDSVREIINSFANRDDARELIERGIFLFFINKTIVPAGVVNYFSLMADAANGKVRTQRKATNHDDIVITEHTSNSYPVTHSIFVRNTKKNIISRTVTVSIEMGASVVTRRGAYLSAVNLKNGRGCSYKLPACARVYSELWKPIERGEFVCEKVFMQMDTKLGAFEEKLFKIIKNEDEMTIKQRREMFMGNLSDITVNAADTRLTKIFALPITDAADDALLEEVKRAVRNYNGELLFALLARRAAIPSSVYAHLIEKLIGIKLLRGKVQILPKIQLTGNFNLSFSYCGKPYHFTVAERGSGFGVSYQDTEGNQTELRELVL